MHEVNEISKASRRRLVETTPRLVGIVLVGGDRGDSQLMTPSKLYSRVVFPYSVIKRC